MLLAACAAPAPPDAVDEARVIEVRMMDDLRFDPDQLDVQVGEMVRFELVNDGQVTHEFLIGDEQAQAEYADEMADGGHAAHAGETVDPGQTVSFDYTFDQAGELLAGCHEPGHYDGGMVATITVRE